MYVVTFYSFKGGVGRTLALVNIGVELANTGRRVLLVDFDVEAPGIDTFQGLAPRVPCPGIVEFITDYLRKRSAPDFRHYHYAADKVGSETLINQDKTEHVGARLIQILRRSLRFPEVQQAVGLLARVEPSPSEDWLDLPSFASLAIDNLDGLTWALCSSRSWQEFAISLFRKITEREGNGEKRVLDTNLALAAIGTKNYGLILDAVDEEAIIAKANIQMIFNFAMAKWGRQNRPDTRMFGRVVELDGEDRPMPDANYQQCLALACAITGCRDRARSSLDRSRQFAEFASSEFSCWRYLRVDEEKFLADLHEIGLLIDGRSIVPEFMR